MRERKSNFELLRVLAMISIPTYHLLLYNGFFGMEWCPKLILAILLNVGCAIPADYIFMSISCYFWVNKWKDAMDIKRYLCKWVALAINVAVIYALRYGVLHGLYGACDDLFVGLFLLHGAWWYIYTYLIMMLIYPALNILLQKSGKTFLLILLSIVIVIFIILGITADNTIMGDLLCFIMVYLIIGIYHKYYSEIRLKNQTGIVILIACYIIMAVICLVSKYYANEYWSMEFANKVIMYVMGKRSVLGAILGMTFFELFKGINIKHNRFINFMGKSTFYVFLLHETLLGILGFIGYGVGDLIDYSIGKLLVFILIYLVLSFIFASLIMVIYNNTIGKVVDRFLQNK